VLPNTAAPELVNLAPAPPAPVVAVVPPVTAPGATEPSPEATIKADPNRTLFPVSRTELETRQVHVYDIDHQAVRDVFDQALASLTQQVPPALGAQVSNAVSRLLRADGSGLSGLLNTVSFPRLTRGGYQAIDTPGGGVGYRSPVLLREGGAITDTVGNATVKFAFYDATPMDWLPSSMYTETYRIFDDEAARKAARSAEVSFFGGPQVNTGDPSAPDTSPSSQKANAYVSAAFSGGRDYSEAAGRGRRCRRRSRRRPRSARWPARPTRPARTATRWPGRSTTSAAG